MLRHFLKNTKHCFSKTAQKEAKKTTQATQG